MPFLFLRKLKPLIALLCCCTVLAGEPDQNAKRGLGQALNNFSARDVVEDKATSLFSFRGKKAGAFFFMGVDCPISKLYVERFESMAKDFKDKGVVFTFVDSNAGETKDAIVAYIKENAIALPVLKDEANRIADLMFVSKTCTVVVLDGEAKVRYRGALDDQYGQGFRKQAAERTYLKDALDAILEKRPVETETTQVAGCVIDRVEFKPSAAALLPRVRPAADAIKRAEKDLDAEAVKNVGNPTYSTDVAAIVNAKCVGCHRPGQVGPFALGTYDDVRRHSGTIREVVDDRRMPPWHADPRYGRFSNDRSLTAVQRAKLLAWIDQGAPLGDPSKTPPKPEFPSEWTIGKPDMIVEIPKDYDVAATGVLDYVYISVPTEIKEDLWIQAAEAQPGDRSVVHHIIVFAFPGPNTKKTTASENPGSRRREQIHICGYAPGDLPTIYPEGVAKMVPAGSKLVFQIHYTPNGKARVDRSRVGFVFAKKPVQYEAFTMPIAQQKLGIPPGDDNFKVESTRTFKEPVRIYGFMPHMHLRGKDFEYKAVFPDGREEILLSVPAFDFGWQSAYYAQTPLLLPKGTRIDCTAHFDNSAGNPLNPDPTKKVRWGDQTFEEMMIGYVDFSYDKPVGSSDEAKIEEHTNDNGSK